MKSRPIPYSPAMVPRVLDGRKTQTRRIVKPQPKNDRVGMVNAAYCGFPHIWIVDGAVSEYTCSEDGEEKVPEWVCPYGQPGDRLWVRQEHYRFGHWEAVPGKKTKGGRQKWKFVADHDQTLYEEPEQYRKGRHHKDPATPAWHKRLARFMPRALSVITLEIVSVRVERLQDISEADAIAEGVQDKKSMILGRNAEEITGPIAEYAVLWESLHGPGSWDANPWVWVIEFKRVEGGAA